jgi:beta-lactamase regulating signal transducer with metallopeptidase domain
MLIEGSGLSTALWITIRATALLGLATIVLAVFSRRMSAASRHFLWTIAIAAVILLPIASVALPEWSVVVRTAQPVPPAAADVTSAVEPVEPAGPPVPAAAFPVDVETPPAVTAASEFPWLTALLAAYAGGVLAMLIHVLAGQRSMRRFVRSAAPLNDSAWVLLLADCARRMDVRRPVRLLRGRERNVPIVLGTLRPSIVVPAIADTWDDDRRQAVLMHELAHVSRYDCLTQMLAVAACTMYWFNPLAWLAARRLRVERELACDDKVIQSGAEGRDYAGHLLEIAYSFGSTRTPALAVGMARRNQLEGRMLAAIDPGRNRNVPPARVRLASVALAAAVLIVFASVRPATATAAPQGPEPDRGVVGYSVESLLRAVIGPWENGARRLFDRAAAAIRSAQANQPGTWEIRPAKAEGMVHLRLTERNSSTGANIRIDQLQGLTAAQLSGPGGPIQFRLRRDAGTFTFEGVMREGIGAGTFSFTPEPGFAGELAKRGFARPTAAEQYELARSDIGFAFVDELNRQGYAKTETADLVRAGQHGVGLAYLQEMGSLGYRLGSLQPLITLRDHGVSPAYIRELAELGYKGLSADELRNARDHGVSGEYVRGMRDGGYAGLPMQELINARDHGVSPEYVRELGEAGHRKVALDELIRVRDHGVSPEYVRDMRQLGHALPLAALVNARDHGVSVEFVREMEALGYTKLSMDALIKLRDHGVSPEYVRALKDLGYQGIAADDLISLRDYGLSPERIRSANAKAGSRLPIDMLKSLAAGGGIR